MEKKYAGKREINVLIINMQVKWEEKSREEDKRNLSKNQRELWKLMQWKRKEMKMKSGRREMAFL